MTDLPLPQALAMVEHGLLADVLPAVQDAHAGAALRAALTIIANVRAQLQGGDRWQRGVLDVALPVASSWPEAARHHLPQVADRVSRCLAEAGAAIEPAEGESQLMQAAQLCLTELWRQPSPDPDLLHSLRQVTRMDAEARAALAH